VPWPEKSIALLGHRWSRRPRHPRRATADVPRIVPAPHRATAPVSPGVSHGIPDGRGFPSLDHLQDGGRRHTSRQGRHMALSYPCDRPMGECNGCARLVWLSHWASGRTTHEGLSCLRHRSHAAGLPAPPCPPRHSCWPTRPRGGRGCRPTATPQAAPAYRSGARPRACALLSTLPPSPPGWQGCRHEQSWEPSVLGRTSRSLPCVPQRAPGLPASATLLTLPAA